MSLTQEQRNELATLWGYRPTLTELRVWMNENGEFTESVVEISNPTSADAFVETMMNELSARSGSMELAEQTAVRCLEPAETGS